MNKEYAYCSRCGILYRMENLMDKTKNFFGMEWAGPVGRTFAQAALPVIVAAGTDWVDADIWKIALLSGAAAVFAKVQAWIRN